MADLSFQFNINNHGQPEYLGYSVFETNSNGQYKSTLIHPEIGNSFYSEILKETITIIEITAKLLTEALIGSVYATLYRGFLGIDAMIFKDNVGLKMQPCIEINSRMNMGILTMQIEKKIYMETLGKYTLFYGGRGEFQQFAAKNKHDKPLKMQNGKLISGFLSLVEPDKEKQFGAYIILEKIK